MRQRLEKRWRQRIDVFAGFTHHVAGDEIRCVLVHVNKAMQLTQDVIRNMPAGARFAIKKNRDVRIANADRLDEGPQAADGGFSVASEFDIVNRQDEGRSTALLLGERSQVAIAGDADDFDALLFDHRC